MSREVTLDDWESVKYRMENEGFHYCFDGYSHWTEIEDEKFQELRKNYLEVANQLEAYVNTKVVEYYED